jgi:ethanolamine utilization protein EutA
VVTDADLDKVAESMAEDLIAALIDPGSDVMQLYLTDPISNLDGIDSVVFSGGVAEFFYDSFAGQPGHPLDRARWFGVHRAT